VPKGVAVDCLWVALRGSKSVRDLPPIILRYFVLAVRHGAAIFLAARSPTASMTATWLGPESEWPKPAEKTI
jgi:hypothetical protein